MTILDPGEWYGVWGKTGSTPYVFIPCVRLGYLVTAEVRWYACMHTVKHFVENEIDQGYMFSIYGKPGTAI